MAKADKSVVAKVTGPIPGAKMFLKSAKIVDGLSQLAETTIDFLSPDKELDLGKLVGKPVSLAVKKSDGKDREFHGICTEASFVSINKGTARYSMEVRPWLWMLTRGRECRIFQEKSAMEIIKEVIKDAGFTSRMSDKTSHKFAKRDYCVQYRESDYAFISRLCEEEGIYFFFDHSGKDEKLIFADGSSAHSAIVGQAGIDFHPPEDLTPWEDDHLYEWRGGEAVTPGKVTLEGYNFEKPKAELKSVKAMPKGKHSHKDYEHYDYTGHHRESSLGGHFAKVKMESMAAEAAIVKAVGNVRGMEVGRTFKLAKHPRAKENGEYLVTKVTHVLTEQVAYEDDAERTSELKDVADAYECHIDAIPKSEPYRAPLITPWPEIPGVHTALVVGKKGEEIWTDKYGRVKVQFHWDRKGKKDENSSCWVRVASSWSGKNWGAVHIPRIGQEVVVQFEEGDPDRPIIVGMLYNADTMPPYKLPANATQSGIKTNKSKGGGGFNELLMEDKKEKELVRFQSERDYEQIVKNNADIKIGLEHKDKGDLTETIHRHKTQTLKTGDHTFKIEKGSQAIQIKKDQTEKIDGKSTRQVKKDVTEKYDAKLTQTVKQNVTQKVTMGNVSQSISKGNYTQKLTKGGVTRKLSMGSEKVTLGMGSYTLKASMGKVTIQAMQGITLKVGASQVKIDMSGVQIKGPMVKAKGTAMSELSAPIVKVEGKAVTMVKGAILQAQGKAVLMLKGLISMLN